MEIHEAVLTLNEKELRAALDATTNGEISGNHGHGGDFVDENGGSVLHKLLQTIPATTIMQAPHRRQIIYMLRNAGFDVNLQQQHGNTALHLVVSEVGGDSELCEALLQCGADMHLKNMNGLSPCDLVASSSTVPKVTKKLFEKFSYSCNIILQPGLWTAVATDDIMSVRKLINLWSRVDLVKGCKTLKQLALEKGTENIIRLIKDIEPSMSLAHAVLASDVKAVRELCNSDAPVNTEFKNLGDMGATPLFYAIMQNNVDLVGALCRKGAKIDSSITFEDDDIAIFFAALNHETDPEVVKLLMLDRTTASNLLSLHYKGKHVLLHCIDNDVSPSAVKHILEQGYPELVALRNPSNQCAREVAEMTGKQHYVQLIDEVVYNWCLDNDSGPRKTLALLGYNYLREAQKDGVPVSEIVQSMETSSNQAKFDTQLGKYQGHIHRLHKAIEAGEADRVRAMLTYTGDHAACFLTQIVYSKTTCNGLPTLHHAVLHRHSYIVQLLCQYVVKTPDSKVDDLRDAHYRTALHYAYAMLDNKDIVNILLDYGASEFTMDKDGRSPLVFRDCRDTKAMKQFLEYHRKQDFQLPEPEPWNDTRPLIRFAGCTHPHHSHSHQPRGGTFHFHPSPPAGRESSLQQGGRDLPRGGAKMAASQAQTPGTVVQHESWQSSFYASYCVIV